MNSAWLKAHWYYIAGGLIGLLVLYEIIQSVSASSSSASGSTDISGGANQLQSLQASADLTDAQANATVEESSYAADVANNQTAAALQLGEVQTAAELDATNQQTSASEATALGEAGDVVEAQKIVTAGQVQETQIEGSTLENIASTTGNTQVALAKVAVSPSLAIANTINTDLTQILPGEKNQQAFLQAFAPVAAEITGQGSSAPGIAAANSKTAVANASNPSSIISAVGSTGISSILSGLFA
jgi:hypothetical protein